MASIAEEYPFRCVLSLQPLVEFWNRIGESDDSAWPGMPDDLKRDLDAAPELLGPIEDLSVLPSKTSLLRRLMAVVFPEAFWETEAVAAVVPFDLTPVLTSPAFRRLFIDDDGAFRARLACPASELYQARIMRAYFLILKQCYNIDTGSGYHPVHVIPDPKTGLDAYYKLKPDFRFVQVQNIGGPEKLAEEQQSFILENLTEPEAIREILPPENYELRGFTVVRAIDVTRQEMMSALLDGTAAGSGKARQRGGCAYQAEVHSRASTGGMAIPESGDGSPGEGVRGHNPGDDFHRVQGCVSAVRRVRHPGLFRGAQQLYS